jgi:immune inhibitor A
VEDVFRDWLVANLVDDPGHSDGRFGYHGLDHRSEVTGSVGLESGVVKGDVHQFAADYYQLEVGDPIELHVEVALTVPLIPAEDTRGGIFWSLRGDSLDTRLTRRFDLSGVERATLRYRVWHDLEPDYDVCYALGSSDGASWLPLVGRWMIDHDHLGSLLGPGYSGRSGDSPLWLEDEVDLSPFTGGQAYVRFECVTDQGYSAAGLALDDLAVPEIGFSDGAESDQGWTSEGFVRVSNLMAQPAAVLVVEMGDGWLSVRDVPLDAAGRGRFPVGGSADGFRTAWAIVTGVAPATLEKMQYRLWVTATEP